jgi:hypothetical protein
LVFRAPASEPQVEAGLISLLNFYAACAFTERVRLFGIK